MNKNAIECQNLQKKLGNKLIIKSLDLTIKHGESIAIMGPSGAGKTTLMNLLSGLELADAGQILINGHALSDFKEPKLTKFRRQHLSYIFQEYNLVDFLSVKQNILLALKIAKQPIVDETYEQLVSAIGLKAHEDKLPHALSGGQKQRVAIARSIMSPSSIIFADEPTGALDIKTRDQIMHLLTNVAKKYQKTLILVTHDPFVASFADKSIFLIDGQIVQTISKSSSDEIAIIIDRLEKRYV